MAALKPLLIAHGTTRAAILVPRDRLVEVVRALAKCGCIHPEPVAVQEPVIARIRHLKNELDMIEQQLLEMLESVEKSGVGVEGAVERQVISVTRDVDLGAARIMEELTGAVRSVERLVERLAEARNPESEVSLLLRLLEAYGFVNVDLRRAGGGRHVRARIYRVPRERAAEFTANLSKLNVVGVVVDDVEEDFVGVAVAYPAWLEEDVRKTAVRVRASPLEVPGELPPLPLEALRRIREELEKLPGMVRQQVPVILKSLEAVRALKSLFSILEATRLTRFTALIHGYVSADNERKLKRILEGLGAAYVAATVEEEAHEKEEPAPSYFRIPSLLRPFSNLVEMAGYPRPGEFVPALLVSITLPIIYGLMFPDLGHGLVLLLAGYYLFYRRLGDRSLGRLVMIFGLSATIVGFLAGEFFGPHPAVAGWLDKLWHGHPPLASPLHPFVKGLVEGGGHAEGFAEEAKLLIYQAIYVSLSIGAVLLALSSWISIVNGINMRDRELVLTGIGKSLVFTSIFVAIIIGALVGEGHTAVERAGSILRDAGLSLVPETQLAMIVRGMFTLGLLVLFAAPIALGHGGMGENLMNGVMEAFDVLLMAIGNTASFMRIMGLMLAHSGLMFGFTILAVMSGPIGGVLVYLLGNLLVLALEALIAYAHSLRLHFYEMFSKFYMDGGRPYVPVRLPGTVEVKIAA
ncbi:MAG: hypothetical protein DSY37_04290 [Hyperthermus sp.]|nr:MAG: hypothetical protein DSY37_04290 [Hyperthermus sp.]